MKPGRECTDMCKEVAKIKEELSCFSTRKTQLDMEQNDLQHRLKTAGFEKGELRNKLYSLIQVFDYVDSFRCWTGDLYTRFFFYKKVSISLINKNFLVKSLILLIKLS